MATRTNNNRTYYINPAYISFVENSGYGANLIQVSASSSCYISVYDPSNGISYSDADKNYQRWKVTAYNNKFPDNDAFYIYVRLERTGSAALVIYSKVLYNVDGTAQDIGGTAASADYYYILIGQVGATNGSSIRSLSYDTGYLETTKGYEDSSDLSGMWEWMSYLQKKIIRAKEWLAGFTVQGVVEFLEGFSFKKGETEKPITDIKRSMDGDGVVPVSDITLPTTKHVDENYLCKMRDDRSKGAIASDKGFEVGKFVTGASGAIIFEDAKTGQTVAELDKLYVRMKAYFETLEIINVNSVGGKMILSPAGSINCIGVEEVEDAYRCYFLGEQDGELIENRFEVGDQAYSEMFNAKEGVSNKVSNIYYWRYVSGISENAVEYNGKTCHYIDLSKTDCDEGSDIPKAGDVINHRGSRYDTDRMNFIEFSSVGVNAPYITLFQGVGAGETPYSLVGKEYVQFGYNQMTGKAFMHVYGDMYVGARDESSYLKYTPEDGLEVCGTISVRSKLSDGRILADELDSLGVDMEKIKRQTDQEYMIWFENHEPTLENKPAVDWTTDELKAEHDQDLLYYREQGKAWRFEDGVWKEITDQDVLRALELIAKTQKDVDDLGYLKRALQNAPETEIENGLVMTSLMAVRNDKGEVESFLNGSTLGEHETYGKLLLAGGIPERNGQTTDLSERAKKACTRIYEDGSLISKTISFDTLEVDANGYYVLPPINGKYGMFYMDSVVGISRVAKTKTFISANDESIVRITGASSVEEAKSISISEQDTIMLFSCQDSTGADMWSAVVLPYWIYGRQASDSINVATIQKIKQESEATDPMVLYILS